MRVVDEDGAVNEKSDEEGWRANVVFDWDAGKGSILKSQRAPK